MVAVAKPTGNGNCALGDVILLDPPQAARLAGLRYVDDTMPGIRRVRRGDSFAFVSPNGDEVEDERELKRIRALVIPPAWENVWVCPRADGHLQATGRDARGRKQYRYHAEFRAIRDEAKFGRMALFGQMLPQIRRRTEEDLQLPGLPRRKVLAAVIRLLERTLIRVGNEEYARANRSFGLTTLRNKHVDVRGATLKFSFRGKGGRDHSVGVRDRRLAGIVRRCQELPGQNLFQYIDDDGVAQAIGSSEVNDYLREVSGQEFTAKDFRTWAGTLLAATALRDIGPAGSETEAKRNIVAAVKMVAERLGNTPTVSRKCYIHPAVIEGYLEGDLLPRPRGNGAGDATALDPDEKAVLAYIAQHAG